VNKFDQGGGFFVDKAIRILYNSPSIRINQESDMSADPRGPIQKIVSIKRLQSEVQATLTCGHVASLAVHFSYKVGRDQHCYQCGKEARNG